MIYFSKPSELQGLVDMPVILLVDTIVSTIGSNALFEACEWKTGDGRKVFIRKLHDLDKFLLNVKGRKLNVLM